MAAKVERIPVSCTWRITHRCNLHCIHCFMGDVGQCTDELSTQEALAVADELAHLGCQRVGLSGGEPFVRKDWHIIAATLASHDIEVTLNTNGLLINQENIELMVEAGVNGVLISLDGDRAAHDSVRVPAGRTKRSRFDAAQTAIAAVSDSPLRTAVVTQINKLNIDKLRWMHETVINLGAEVWQVQLAIPTKRIFSIPYPYLIDPSQLSDLMDELAALINENRIRIAVGDNIGYYHKHEPVVRGASQNTKSIWTGCLAGCRTLGITASGDVKGCTAQHHSFSKGNVRQKNLSEIWNDPDNFVYNTGWDEKLLEGKCANCPYRRVCRGGCHAMAYAVTGTIYDNPFCVQRT